MVASPLVCVDFEVVDGIPWVHRVCCQDRNSWCESWTGGEVQNNRNPDEGQVDWVHKK